MVAKEPLVEEEYQNNEHETNTQKEDGNENNSSLVKFNDKIPDSETTEYEKKEKKEVQKK